MESELTFLGIEYVYWSVCLSVCAWDITFKSFTLSQIDHTVCIPKFQGNPEHEPLHHPAEQHAAYGHLRLVARRPRLHLKGRDHSYVTSAKMNLDTPLSAVWTDLLY